MEYSFVYYLEPEREPFFSITALPREAAMERAALLAPGTRSPKNRFCAEDFPGYYDKRLDTEAWMYRRFVEKGGTAEIAHPLYMTLGESEFLHQWFGNGWVYVFDPADMPGECISFTLGDSMSVIDRDDKEVYTLAEMEALLKTDAAETIKKRHGIHYIEVQLWSRRIPPAVQVLEGKG